MWIENCEPVEEIETTDNLRDNIFCEMESSMREKMGIWYDYSLDRNTFPDEPENIVIALKNLENRAGARIKIPIALLHEANNYIVLKLQDPLLDWVVSEAFLPYMQALNEKIDHIR